MTTATQKTKKCVTCGKKKAVSQFWKRSDNGNLRGSCKGCLNAARK